MKSKKVLTILLSMAIMLTFMPTMAFAQDPLDPEHPHSWTFNEELSTEPTCEAYGVYAYSCEGQELDDEQVLDCNAVKYYLHDKKEHDTTQTRLTKEEYLKARIAQEGDMPITAIVKFYQDTADDCYAYVDQCKDCKEYVFETDYNNEDWQGHVKPEGTKTCQETFVCDTCKETVENTGEHTWDAPVLVGHRCGKNSTVENPTGYEVYEKVCKVCGEKETYTSEEPSGEVEHRGIPEPTYTAEDYAKMSERERTEVESYFVSYGTDWYAPNEFVDDSNLDVDTYGPTCTNDSSDDYAYLVCEECGTKIGDDTCKVKATGHADPVEITVPATCTEDGFTYEICPVCFKVLKDSKSSDKTGHKYVRTVVREPNIYSKGITVVECENCGEIATNRYLKDSDYPWDEGWGEPDSANYVPPTVINSKPADDSGDWYFIGFDGEFLENDDYSKPVISGDAIKIADWKALTPHWGAYEDLQPATCTSPLLQAKKDSVSGDWNVHELKTIGEPLGHIYDDEQTVDPTCGTYGYSYCVCSRCNEFVKPEGAEVADINVDVDGDGYDDLVYDGLDPVVKKGTPCDLEWVITKEATPTEDGVKQLKCKVCGYVDSEVPYEYKSEGSDEEQKAKDAALEAAAPVIADANAKVAAGNLTDDSAKAIAKAKAELEQVMANGSSELITKKTEALKTAVANAKTKAASKLVASAKKIKASKKKTKKFSAAKAFTVSGNAGAVSYKKVSGNKKIKVASNGKVTVKKGLKKGKTYKVTVAVTDAGNGNVNGATKNVTLKVKIKK